MLSAIPNLTLWRGFTQGGCRIILWSWRNKSKPNDSSHCTVTSRLYCNSGLPRFPAGWTSIGTSGVSGESLARRSGREGGAQPQCYVTSVTDHSNLNKLRFPVHETVA